MAFASIKKQEADAAHENEYKNKEFIIAQFQRSGFFNFFPYSMVYGLSDIGAWYGLISTDGEKVIITRSTVSDMAKIKKKWTFQKSEIHKTTDGTFSFRIVFDKKKPGLTMSGMGGLMKLVLTLAGIFPLLVVGALGGRQLNLQINNEFETEKEIKELLSKN